MPTLDLGPACLDPARPPRRPHKFAHQELHIKVRRYLRAVCYLFNVHTLALAMLSCIAVFLCDHLNFSYNMVGRWGAGGGGRGRWATMGQGRAGGGCVPGAQADASTRRVVVDVHTRMCTWGSGRRAARDVACRHL